MLLWHELSKVFWFVSQWMQCCGLRLGECVQDAQMLHYSGLILGGVGVFHMEHWLWFFIDKMTCRKSIWSVRCLCGFRFCNCKVSRCWVHYFILKHTLLTWIVSTDLVCISMDAMLRNGTWECIREAVMVNRFKSGIKFWLILLQCHRVRRWVQNLSIWSLHVTELRRALSSMSSQTGFGDCRLALSSSTGRRNHQSKKLLMQWAVKCGSYPIISSS